ncbi:Zn-dependent oxidoreductase [Mycolicibacterium aromaticivorans JS19b1 = JCM 16368]|uniref:Zn-dependent oxidoreductase n=1 Tax=Mycolicibacterium aromaticivorans JS19b1 = JCM 16368 TaxID=1440774 RepID=A0A064CG75_9MYCO|nr:zinc-binding alcohol dehydrogenase family protein [Mycolicibacterium aromaticivorans]KDE99300.1 Zn-dependent oxidoreductase [Mycolicibacterium aromaticivorans JS19b1 = JCM 16368]
MSNNTAAWIGSKGAALEVKAAPYPHPGEHEIVVRNHAVAINPYDWIIQATGGLFTRWITYPFILGSDLAGEVVEVGPGVTRFSVGDRVLGHAVGTEKARNSAAEGAFQEYTIVLDHMAAPIPATMAYEDAAVLPLALSTAACGLFQKDQLGLEYPSATAKPTGKTLLVWGGSTSVGSNAIQLAVAAGYDVIATASPRNFDYVKGLGAGQVFDYNSSTVVADIVAALHGRTIAGALAVATDSAGVCAEILGFASGTKFVSIASPPVSFASVTPGRSKSVQLARLIARVATSTVSTQIRFRMRHVGSKMIWGASLMDDEVSTVIYNDFLPQALADGRYRAAPAPLIIGTGLHHIQAGLDAQKKGVSAKKIVITL